MKGRVLVVLNSGISEFVFKEQNKSLINEAKNMNIDLVYKTNAEMYTFIDNNTVKSHNSYNNFNYALFFDKDVHLARSLEIMGVKVVNSADTIAVCENKATLYQILAKNNINIPKTVIFPTMDNYDATIAHNFLEDAIIDLGLPMVVKGWFGDSGKNVFLAKNRAELYALVDGCFGKQLILQEYVLESSGTDIRVFVCNHKVFAAVRRQGNGGDFRSNISLGGVIQKYIPTVADETLAVTCSKVINCKFAIVDIMKSINGPVVCEVNTYANINYLQDASDVNIAKIIFKNIK